MKVVSGQQVRFLENIELENLIDNVERYHTSLVVLQSRVLEKSIECECSWWVKHS